MLGSMREKSGRVPRPRRRFELGRRAEWVPSRSFSRSRASRRRSWQTNVIGLFATNPRSGAVQNDRFMEVCGGHLQNQWSKTPSPGRCREHRQLLGDAAGHDVGVILIGGWRPIIPVKVEI